MPSRYEGKIENIDESSCFKAWPGSKLESIDIAKKLLNRLGTDEHIIHVLKDRCFIIKKLSELDMNRYVLEDNLVSCLGLNVGQGTEEIAIALRDGPDSFREYGPDQRYENHNENKEGNTIVDVFLHELAHMNHSLHYSSHGKEFHTRLRELKKIYYTSYNRKNISNPGRMITMNSNTTNPNKEELRCIRISRYSTNSNNNSSSINASSVINYLCKTRFLDWMKRFSTRYCDDIYSKYWSIHIIGLIGLGAGAFGSTKFIQLLKSRK